MRRRRYLASVAAGATGLAGWAALGTSGGEDKPGYRGGRGVVTEHPDLEVTLRGETAFLGETVAFDITNAGDSAAGLGCHNPWALQRRTGDGWAHVAWTAGRYHLLCLTTLPPGESLVERLTLSAAGLEDQGVEVRTPPTAGRYRFLLLGPAPYLATEFDVRGAV